MCLERLKKHSSWAHLFLRVAIGAIFLVQGIGKFGAIDGVTQMLAGLGFPAAATFAWILALVETIGGAMLIVGLLTRYAALPLAVVMLVVLVLKWTAVGMFEGGFLSAQADLALFAGLLALLFEGGGKWALYGKR